jgi:transcriptional regulator with XRE-family HTH domain
MTELVDLRRKRMTAAEAARRMGVSRQQVYNLENMRQGCPSLDSVSRYAWAIGAKVVVQVLRSIPR